MPERWDYIIAGGGSAGCVLASRLSESPSANVILIEAGIDTPPDNTPADILDAYPSSYSNPRYRWPLVGHALTADTSPMVPLPHASVMGGGSSIMGMIMLRGFPADFSAWEAAGAKGWSWRNVLPYFRLLENDLDFGGEMHGKNGPTEIRRHRREDWPELAIAAGKFSQRNGMPFIADMNADFRDGYGALPIAGSPTRRATSASAYLTAEVRARPNLRIISSRRVKGLIYDGTRVTGVRLEAGEQEERIEASETILCMGALLSPHFLLREGIGDPEHLVSHGVVVRHARRGVGANLQNHAALLTIAHLKRSAIQRKPQRNHNNSILRYSSSVGGGATSDMALMVGTRVAWHAIARRLANFTPVLMSPASRGRVRLSSQAAMPLIEYNLLGEEIDRARLVEGMFKVSELITSPEMRGLIGTTIGANRIASAASFNQKTLWNIVRSGVIAGTFDHVPAAGDWAVAKMGDYPVNVLAADSKLMSEFVRSNVTPLAHNAGTCRMGAPDDPLAVVDHQGRVIGMEGLRIVDASIMPTVPRANTNLPVLMIAERISDDIRGISRTALGPSSGTQTLASEQLARRFS